MAINHTLPNTFTAPVAPFSTTVTTTTTPLSPYTTYPALISFPNVAFPSTTHTTPDQFTLGANPTHGASYHYDRLTRAHYLRLFPIGPWPSPAVTHNPFPPHGHAGTTDTTDSPHNTAMDTRPVHLRIHLLYTSRSTVHDPLTGLELSVAPFPYFHDHTGFAPPPEPSTPTPPAARLLALAPAPHTYTFSTTTTTSTASTTTTAPYTLGLPSSAVAGAGSSYSSSSSPVNITARVHLIHDAQFSHAEWRMGAMEWQPVVLTAGSDISRRLSAGDVLTLTLGLVDVDAFSTHEVGM